MLSSLAASADPTKKSYNELIELLQNHLSPIPNPYIQQNRFISFEQRIDETVANFTVALQD